MSERLKRAEDVVDEEGYPIADNAVMDVALVENWAKEQHEAELERDALRAGGEAKLEEAQRLTPTDGTPPNEVPAAFEQRGGAYNDANHLIQKSMENDDRAFRARQQVKEITETSRKHVDKNLPAYVEAATIEANEDLGQRLGRIVPVTRGGEIVGFNNIELVNTTGEPGSTAED